MTLPTPRPRSIALGAVVILAALLVGYRAGFEDGVVLGSRHPERSAAAQTEKGLRSEMTT